MRRWTRIVVAALALAVVPAGAAVGKAKDTLVAFQSPSHAIGCFYSAPAGEDPSLRCDVDRVAHPAARPAGCGLDYGSAFGLGVHGRGQRLCAGDTALNPKARVIPYGRTRRLGPFTCVSRRAGLRCTSRSRHGFDLSRARQKLF